MAETLEGVRGATAAVAVAVFLASEVLLLRSQLQAYRARPGARPAPSRYQATTLDVVWTLVPVIIVVLVLLLALR
jgi:heme/copper-type cytochrome/quinol oxidase subunit 2